MARQNCPNRAGQPGRYQPGPLYDRITVPEPEPEAAVPLPSLSSSARQALVDTEMRICHYSNPIPASPTSAECEMLCLLRRQNELLTEILGALNAQLAARLTRL